MIFVSIHSHNCKYDESLYITIDDIKNVYSAKQIADSKSLFLFSGTHVIQWSYRIHVYKICCEIIAFNHDRNFSWFPPHRDFSDIRKG